MLQYLCVVYACCRCTQQEGVMSVALVATDLLLTQSVSNKSQNQNAAFVAWFVSIIMQSSTQFRRDTMQVRKRCVQDKVPICYCFSVSLCYTALSKQQTIVDAPLHGAKNACIWCM